jgi:hypothetical protein
MFWRSHSLPLQGKVNSSERKTIDIGLKYRRGQNLTTNRKQVGAVRQPIRSRKG